MSERSMAHPEATQKCPKARTENTGAQGGMDKHPGKDRHGSSWRDGCGQACLGFCRVSAAATCCSDLPRVPGKPLTPCVLYQLLPFPKCWLPAGERIRITEHPLEIHLLFAVWTRLLLPDNAPAPDAELMKPGEWHVKGNWKKRGIHGSVWRKPPSPRKSFQDYGNILPCEDGALNNHNPFLEGAAASRDSERSSWGSRTGPGWQHEGPGQCIGTRETEALQSWCPSTGKVWTAWERSVNCKHFGSLLQRLLGD